MTNGEKLALAIAGVGVGGAVVYAASGRAAATVTEGSGRATTIINVPQQAAAPIIIPTPQLPPIFDRAAQAVAEPARRVRSRIRIPASQDPDSPFFVPSIATSIPRRLVRFIPAPPGRTFDDGTPDLPVPPDFDNFGRDAKDRAGDFLDELRANADQLLGDTKATADQLLEDAQAAVGELAAADLAAAAKAKADELAAVAKARADAAAAAIAGWNAGAAARDRAEELADLAWEKAQAERARIDALLDNFWKDQKDERIDAILDGFWEAKEGSEARIAAAAELVQERTSVAVERLQETFDGLADRANPWNWIPTPVKIGAGVFGAVVARLALRRGVLLPGVLLNGINGTPEGGVA